MIVCTIIVIFLRVRPAGPRVGPVHGASPPASFQDVAKGAHHGCRTQLNKIAEASGPQRLRSELDRVRRCG